MSERTPTTDILTSSFSLSDVDPKPLSPLDVAESLSVFTACGVLILSHISCAILSPRFIVYFWVPLLMITTCTSPL